MKTKTTLKFLTVLFLSIFMTSILSAQAQEVRVVKKSDGHHLLVDGQEFFMNGMNWDYFPRGTNYNYSLWNQSDDLIMAALDSEMSLLQNMGVNVIRQYTGIPKKWIEYIYNNYGIYTMLNHSFGRYGLTINGEWRANTDYADPDVRKLLLTEVSELVEEYKDTEGLLLFLLGNENNYGLFWEGAETEDIPFEERKSTQKAIPMYSLFNEAAVKMKGIDDSHPIAICNGDLLFLEVIVEECPDVDIYGTNMYRGKSFGDAFERVEKEYGKPIIFTEFGADAFNAIDNQEDQHSQAFYMVENWKEIYQNRAGLGLANNSLGGFTFQFSDGWWKYGQTTNLNVHDNNASWSNGGYKRDHVEGENNMNEEWFGVCAKGATSPRGLYELFPRASYYALKEAHMLPIFDPNLTAPIIEAYFSGINLMDAVLQARGDKAVLNSESVGKIGLSRMRADFSTFITGGDKTSTPENPVEGETTYPNSQGFDHMQSYFIGVEANPAPGLRANVDVNILGNVAQNPINEIFYENRGRPITVITDEGEQLVNSNNRVQIYSAEAEWNHDWFNLKSFYRTGHYHWGYEGDFFGLYPEANYGPNMDIYNGEAPFGFEFEGKKSLSGLKAAFGPELWWGANPAVLLKYSKDVGPFELTGVYHEDIDDRGAAVSSFAIPQPLTRRATVHASTEIGKLGVEVGGIWGGQPLNGREFQLVRGDKEGGYRVYQDEIESSDNWGGKMKLTYSSGPVNVYAQGAAMGLVANGGADYTRTFTGWRLKDSGSGNQYNFLTGFTYTLGKLQIAPNFLWQKPIEGPIPGDVAAPARPRNIVDDPFVVRSNRETTAGEILITFDPTPGTWMYEWDNDRAEDAKFAMSAGFVYRHLPTTQDAAIGIFADGRTTFAFPGAAPAQDLWEAHTRIVSKLNPNFGLITNLYAGTAQANGSDDRLIERYGGDLRMVYKNFKLTTMVKVDDWGPFDYHRDFNLTFPLQTMIDLSIHNAKPDWFNMPSSRIGFRYTWRSMDQFSPRYCPAKEIDATGLPVCNPEALGFGLGNEWEFRTYLQISLGN